MRIVERNTVVQNMSSTKTVEHFGHLLGTKPHKLGKVVTMYPHLSISYLTDALKNVYFNPKKNAESFTPINSMAVQWNIDVNYIKKVKIVSAISGNGANLREESIVLEERYYDKNDTFTLENKQQLFVTRVPVKLAQKRWKYTVRLVGDGSKTVNTAYTAAGKTTRYRSNYYPELSERGYTKFHSNTETHRNYLSRHRASVDWSADYAMGEDIFIEAGKGKEGGSEYYKMNRKEKECMDHFLLSREQSCIFSQTNFDVNGKCQMQDERERDIPMGDGVIPQIERYCDKFLYSVLTSATLNDVLSSMTEKSDQPTNNTYAVICNERMYRQFGELMQTDLRFQNPNDGSYFYSKSSSGQVKVGAEYVSYTLQGNTITFMPNRALSQEYPDYAYGIFLDTTADLTSGRPNVAMFTLNGSEMISGTLNGMGGADGQTSGPVVTGVHGSQYHLIGYSGCVVFNPYKSFILEEARV